MEQIQPLQGTPNLKRDHHLIFILGSIPCIQVRFSKPFKSALGSLTWKQRWMFLNSHPKFLRTNRTWLYFGFKTKYFNIWTTCFNIIIITLLFWHASKSCQNEDECCCTVKFYITICNSLSILQRLPLNRKNWHQISCWQTSKYYWEVNFKQLSNFCNILLPEILI